MADIEKPSFNTIVFTSGGMAPECAKVNKKLAKIADKHREPYVSVSMIYIRIKLRFALSTKEHACCISRLLRQLKWCSPPRSHGHGLQSNSKANLLRLNCGELSRCQDFNITCVIGEICHGIMNEFNCYCYRSYTNTIPSLTNHTSFFKYPILIGLFLLLKIL